MKLSSKTHEELVTQAMGNPAVRAAVQHIEQDEGVLIDMMLRARAEAGLTQEQVAQRMNTHAPAIARLERSLAINKRSTSISTLRKYAQACGKRLVVQFA